MSRLTQASAAPEHPPTGPVQPPTPFQGTLNVSVQAWALPNALFEYARIEMIGVAW
jgi:hypothetical protein